ncbi:MAG: type 2 isopentenyl-diphosphate Delta-isomerase [Melioribacteraceae bacterium]|nr:type 2 isopentenyl-diphosphate Delta-isomerase [Melioribacteraceae bacterium]
MTQTKQEISKRKQDHLEICLSEDVDYRKTNGFERYDFPHFATTEVVYNEIDISTTFFKRKIDYPFLISSMTGGTGKAKDINYRLALAAKELNIPIGVGSQRLTLEDDKFKDSFDVLKKFSDSIPVLSNIGAAQVAKLKKLDSIKKITDQINASALIIHLNPLQEIIQKNGEPDFSGLIKNIKRIVKKIGIPVIAKEVGAGISAKAAEYLLEAGVKGIDVAGAGGTSWSAVELLRNKRSNDSIFWNWGLPTSYCIRTVNELRKKYNFVLISSGGINSADEIAKSVALGADLTASAKKVLIILNEGGVEGLIEYVKAMFEDVKKIMYLTGCESLKKLKKLILIRKEELF